MDLRNVSRIVFLRVLPLALLTLLIAGLLFFLWLRSGGRPLREGERALAGISQEVRVRFDGRAVPHVEASSGEDLMAALGYLHANDRMGQMELGRRAAYGRLAERLGAPLVEADIEARRLRLDLAAEAIWEASSPTSRRWLAAYASGVNAWLTERDKDLPPTVRLLGGAPEPWQPKDSLAFALLMAKELSFWAGRPEEERFLWLRAFGEARTRDLLGQDFHLPPEIARLAEEGPRGTGEEGSSPALLDGAPGSNNWALGPTWTASGGALIANDPHLALGLPSVWYQASLDAPGYRASGMTLPGLPGVVIGRGRRASWALTNVMLDDHDLFFERLDETGKHVARGEDWVPILEEEAVIRIRGGGEHRIVLRQTDRGILLEADPRRGLPARSLLWMAHVGGDVLSAFETVAQASMPADVGRRLQGYICPAQNLVMAFENGELLATLLGRVPRRRTGDGRMPSPGWDPAYGWSGLVDWELNPRLTGDALVTANAKVFDTPVEDPFLVADYMPDDRERRLREILGERRDWRLEEMGGLQGDAVSLYARDLLAALETPQDPEAARAFEILRGWDHELSEAGPSALFAVFERELGERVFGDEAASAELPPFVTRARLLRLAQGGMDPVWFDDVSTPDRVESAKEVVEEALVSAWGTLRESFGEDPGTWRFDRLSHLTLRHPLDPLTLIGRWTRRGPYGVLGDASTPNAMIGSWRGDRFQVLFGPSMRWAMDWGRPDAALSVIPGGQSGHPADPHYDDQIETYLEGRLLPAPWSEAEIAAAVRSELRLVPSG